MRKGILVFAVGLVSLVALAADSAPPVPKEGSSPYVNVLSSNVKALPLGKERVQFSYEAMGVSTSPTGEGLLHNSSLRCIGGMHIVNGAWDDESGSCIYTRPDGDQVFATYKATGKLGGTSKGVVTYVGGTGKMAGITGSGDWTRVSVRPAAEGTSQSVLRGTSKYKLP
jgi:hypothetical protein